MRHRVYLGKGDQTLVTIPHRAGQPVRVTAGTYAILDARHGDDSAEHVVVAAGTVATIDATSTTLAARAGRGAEDRRALTLASTAGLAEGHMYLLESAAGQVELVKIAKVASGTVARAAAEIRGDFATGATLRGVEVSATFPEVQADDDDNLDALPFLIVWTFAGFPPLRETIYAERGEESQLATLDDLRELDPMITVLAGDRVDPAAALVRAHKDLRTELQIAGASESDLLTGPIGRDYVTYRAAVLCLGHLDDPAARRKVEGYEKRCAMLLGALVIGERKPDVAALEKVDETAIVDGNPAQIFVQLGYARRT